MKARDYLKSYEEMLEEAYKNLPKKAVSSERFEPPVAESFIEGNKTILKNFGVICEKLRREPSMIAKYFAKELAVPTSVQRDKLVLQGKFYERVINERLANFINTYVICKQCKKPDTKLVDVERGIKMLVCEACGARAPVKAP